MKGRLPSLVVAVLCLLLSAGGAFAYQITGTAQSREGHLVRTELTVQVSPQPLDRFKIVRLARDVPAERLGPSILFLPPLGSSFSFYEQRDESGGRGSSIAELFALRGYDVYGYSPRYSGIPAGTCEAGLFDCSLMAGWDLQSMVDDVAFIRSQMEALHPGTVAVTGGASLGGILAFAVVNAHPGDWDGIIPWEGMLESSDPAVQALNQGYCAALQAQVDAGLYVDGVGANLFKEVAKQAELVPEGLTPIPLFPPTFTNHQVLILFLAVPTPGPASMPTPGYVQMAGSLAEDRLFFADEARVYENVSRFNSYVPNVLVRDISCSLAGVDSQHVANLHDYTGAVLAIGAGRGFGPYMADQVAQLGSTEVTIRVEPEFGHIDHFMTPRHRRYVELPILRWLQRLF